MKVRELMEAIESMDLDAEVLLMCQQNWPFEYSLQGVVSRDEMVDDDDDMATEGVTDGAEYGDGEDPSDVFLVQGEQLRYGSKRAWDAC